jgi:para-aminobenzoate synthetase component I
MDKTLNLKVWVNGKIIDQDKAVVSALSPGFQYGAGLFETMRVDNGKIFYLKEHVERLNSAWEKLFFQSPPYIDWGSVIDALIKENNLQDQTAVVKLLVSKESQNSDEKIFLAAFVRQYTHRLEMLNQKGLNLITYPEARQTPLADYKTLNYLYYDRAGQFAKSCGGDEAVILNADFTISETNTASIFALKDKTIIVPESLYVLNGVTINSILTILSDKGYGISQKPIHKDQFYLHSNIIVANALMGAVKVLTIDGKKIEQKHEICSMLNKQLFKIDK